ncbi:MAG: hypothetical protein JXX28_11865 [Deltaproteobacteria bacterium]|nr:hypothetical protein [Deltaproteobacteria bacterium]
MQITLEGSSPGAHTAGILLLTRARQLGLPLTVAILGDPEEVAHVYGPAVVYAPVLASCGVGREAGSGATVVVPGPPGDPVLVTVTPHGMDGWFEVDRAGRGAHPAAKAYAALSVDPRPEARELSRELRELLTGLGMSTDPAVLDVLFSADVPPLTRLSVGLRAGRALSGRKGQPITRFMSGTPSWEEDPLPTALPPDVFQGMVEDGGLQWILDGLSTAVRDRAEHFVAKAKDLLAAGGTEVMPLLYALAELTSHLIQLPPQSILPPLGAAEDSVAVGLHAAMSAEGRGDAAEELAQVYRFLGGRYVSTADHPVKVCDAPAPEDRVERWRWFCSQSRQGRKDADAIWPGLVDPAH